MPERSVTPAGGPGGPRYPNAASAHAHGGPWPNPGDSTPAIRRNPHAPWSQQVQEVVDQAHQENLGGKHRAGFCEACADAYIIAQCAVPGGPADA